MVKSAGHRELPPGIQAAGSLDKNRYESPVQDGKKELICCKQCDAGQKAA